VGAPRIEIGEISSGFGSVTVQIKNTGAGDAVNVTWSISLQGGLVLLGRQTTGTILKILPGFNPLVKTGFLFGLGKTTITVTADTASKTVSAFLLGPFVIIQD
jgi:hypothetical protein